MRPSAAQDRPIVALVLAGGSGTRLWPLSRRDRPKQLLPLVSERSMVAETVDRLAPLVPPERVLVLTNARYVEVMRDALPELLPEHIIGEPSALGTAPAIALGTALALAIDPEAVVAVLSADHHIEPAEAFRDTLARAVAVADQGYLVTIGIPPSHPETGFGYVEPGDALGVEQAFVVSAFHEKPDAERAQGYVDSGTVLWNAGIFVWNAATIRDAFLAHLPGLGLQLDAVRAVAAESGFGSPALQEAIDAMWAGAIERTTIDYGIMEPAQNVAVVRASFGWSDIGSWLALGQALVEQQDGNGNVTHGRSTLRDVADSYIFNYGDRLIAAIGVQDLVIVDTGDAVLVCPKNRAQDVKALVDSLAAAGREDLC